MGYGGEGKGKGKSSREWAEAGRALLQATIEPRQFTVNVVLLSGQEILDKVELQGTENVSILIDKVLHLAGWLISYQAIRLSGNKAAFSYQEKLPIRRRAPIREILLSGKFA